jgi:transcriptional regulator with XRE-family HTH domain
MRKREAFARSAVAALAARRQASGMTRQTLADQSGVSKDTIAKIEQGATTDPGFSIVAAIAEALGLGLDELASHARGLEVEQSGEPQETESESD